MHSFKPRKKTQKSRNKQVKIRAGLMKQGKNSCDKVSEKT